MSNREPVLEKKKLEQNDEPPMYSVVFHNDDFTPMDFVVQVVQAVFGLNDSQAEQVTWAIHTAGKKAVGSFTKEVAETKSHMVNEIAKENQHPLLTDVQKAK